MLIVIVRPQVIVISYRNYNYPSLGVVVVTVVVQR